MGSSVIKRKRNVINVIMPTKEEIDIVETTGCPHMWVTIRMASKKAIHYDYPLASTIDVLIPCAGLNGRLKVRA